jgi:hypothetical protein
VLAIAPDIVVGGAHEKLRSAYLRHSFGWDVEPDWASSRFDLLAALELYGQGPSRFVIGYDEGDERYVRSQLPKLRKFVSGVRAAALVPYRTGQERTALPRKDHSLIGQAIASAFERLGSDWRPSFR